ncbi:vWA domain-containing protein, partial [Roseisolibacter sp. H3M3-2]|uniref:vWA domain-containing protein n=1 Tax=Roseisolibacter sp. H3M3-2 TaxID=3031323 RepID=UPI0023DAB71B
MPALDSVLELLLKYRPALFAQGRLAFDAPRGAALALVLAGLLLAAVVAWTYRSARGGASARDRAVLTGLRVAAIAVLVACLLRPVLVLAAAVPRRNTVAVLVDDSRSMRVRDWGGKARADAASALFGAGTPLRRALEAQFGVRVYRFAEEAGPAAGVDSLAFAGERTRLGAALDRVREDLDGVPLSGVVVLTDGADGAPTALADAVLALRARGTPVFPVGVGAPAAVRDVEVSRVEAPRTVLQGSALSLHVVLEHRGLAGATVPVTVEAEGGHLLARKEVVLPEAGDALPVALHVPMPDAGARRLVVRVPRQQGETLAENNERPLLVDVRDAPARILYFEGEPRFEPKFVRRAVADDERLQVALLQRTADGKYLRLGVADSLDLVGGFPATREALFAYDGVILGSVEASAFSAEQLRMLAEFVSVRGGGLLFLGGRRAFAEGGYAGTPLEEAMPVQLGAAAAADGDRPIPAAELTERPTPAGAAHAPLQLAADDAAS